MSFHFCSLCRHFDTNERDEPCVSCPVELRGIHLGPDKTKKEWFVRYLDTQKRWSAKVFGPGRRTKGIVEHIKLELDEIKEAPWSLEEWCDVVILALDGAWRAGFSAQEIQKALVKKQKMNKARKWPPPVSEDIPVLHRKDGDE